MLKVRSNGQRYIDCPCGHTLEITFTGEFRVRESDNFAHTGFSCKQCGAIYYIELPKPIDVRLYDESTPTENP